MFNFLFGLAIFFTVFLAKFGITQIILYKKNLYLWLAVVIIAEISAVSALYIAFSILNMSGEKFIFGFIFGLVTLLLIYVISFMTKDSKD